MDSKLKIYLRGLGIGIMVTALILAIANLNRKNNTMTDAEVIARAQELGMVSSNSYSLTDAESDKANANSQNTADEIDGNSASDNGTDNQNVDDQNSDNQDNTDNSASDSLDGTDSSDNTDNAGNTGNTTDDTASGIDTSADADASNGDNQNTDTSATGTTDNTTATGEEISITVSAGSGSETLAASLLRAGLIDDSKAFNDYMVSNGYATRIRVGTFQIPMGSTYEEICKIVTGAK